MLYETIAFPDNAPLQCSIVEVEEYPFHMHDDVLEIMFALEGSFELTVVNNVLDMKAGDIYVSCPRELHRLCAYPHTRGTVMLLHINVEAYRAEFPDLRTYQFANSALENNTAGIQMLGSYLKKQLPRLLDRTGTETAAYREVGEKILNTLIKEFQCYYLGSGFPEFNNAYKDAMASHGMIFSGTSPDGSLVEMVEVPGHPWFVGCQFHPEFKSNPMHAHPLFKAFIGAAVKQRSES